MNTVQVIGRLGQDPETRFTDNGNKVTNLNVADTQKYKDKKGTIWWRCSIWGDRFDKMLEYLKSGSAVIVTGEMKIPEIYETKEGYAGYTPELTVNNLQFVPIGAKKEEEEEEKKKLQVAPQTEEEAPSVFDENPDPEGIPF